jgi:hypothetical protein
VPVEVSDDVPGRRGRLPPERRQAEPDRPCVVRVRGLGDQPGGREPVEQTTHPGRRRAQRGGHVADERPVVAGEVEEDAGTCCADAAAPGTGVDPATDRPLGAHQLEHQPRRAVVSHAN